MAIAVAAIGSRPDFTPYVALQTSRSGPVAQLDTLHSCPVTWVHRDWTRLPDRTWNWLLD